MVAGRTKADVSIAEEELRLERNSRRDPAHNILTMRNLHNCAIFTIVQLHAVRIVQLHAVGG